MGKGSDPVLTPGVHDSAATLRYPPQEPRMRRMLLPACLLLAAAPLSAAAAEACDVPPRFGLSPLAVAIRNTACNEHRLWYRPFIDREGRAASLSVTEAESDHLADNGLIAWQRVAGYWRNSGTLNAMGSIAGASSCLAPLGTRYTDSDCRAFLIDNPWSAAFISWVMVQSGVPGFNTSPRHIDYIRAAYQGGPRACRTGWSTRPRPNPHRATCCASCATAAPRSATAVWCRHWAMARWATGNRIAKWWWRPTSAATRPCTSSVAT